MPIPKNFSYAEAAAVPEAFLTAYQGSHIYAHNIRIKYGFKA